MNRHRFLLLMGVLLSVLWVGIPSLAQTDPVNMRVEAGFNNFQRPGYWTPLQIQVSNDGVGFSGRLTVRPETSGRAVTSAYSTPIDLPNGSEKTVFLYIQAQESASTIIVELIDDEGVRITDQAIGLTPIAADDVLHMTISGTGASSIPLNSVAKPGTNARQGRWEVSNLPSDVAALNAVDTILLYDVQTDTFTVDQLTALEAWVTMGGHLITIGGPSWAQTASGLPDTLLPFMPDGSQNIEDVNALATYLNRDDALTGLTFITTGSIAEDAEVRITSAEDLPLLVRRELGLGIVDFLTVDPTLDPLRNWEQLNQFWFTVVTDLPPEPGWQRGLLDLQDAARAVAILPNVELLPPASSMILFITAYILLIGPINYFILSRLRRRAWAWGTIPMFIVAFTLLAWNVGFNLRGSEVIVSRLYVVQSFSNSDIAYQDQLVGVLSPRRDLYTVSAPDDSVMGFLPGVEAESPFSANVTRSTANILQGEPFTAPDLAIDGGIFANFYINQLVDAPDISGSATIGYLPETTDLEDTDYIPTQQSIRGVVRNDSDITLEDVVIFARNRFYRVNGVFEPGDILDFDTADFEYIDPDLDDILPMAVPIESRAVSNVNEDLSDRRSVDATLVTSRVLLDIDWTIGRNRFEAENTFDSTDDEQSRRRALLRSFMRDQNASLGVGNQVYVMGWSTAEQPDDITVADTPYNAVDTTLHIIEIETDVETPPSNDSVIISGDQFTWQLTDVAVGQSFGNFSAVTLVNPGWANYQLTPLDGAVLETVDTMIVEVNRGTALGNEVDISLWNRQTEEWDILQNNRNRELYTIEDPTPYLGRDNQVEIRFEIDSEIAATNNGRILQTRIVHIGSF